MKIISSELEQIAAIISQYPKSDLKEIAFAGRSNVGKSSFINAVINRKNLARTSSKPGKTRTVNFYKINNEFRLVDLPGYGYAQVSKSEKEKWGKIIETYLTNRGNLCDVILVVDIRHAPSKDVDGITQALNDPTTTVLDARSKERFHGEAPEPRPGLACGHMPGAKNLPYTLLLDHGHYRPDAPAIFRQHIGDPHPLVTTCGSGVTACILALAATEAGYTDVKVYDGSWAEWGLESLCNPIA